MADLAEFQRVKYQILRNIQGEKDLDRQRNLVMVYGGPKCDTLRDVEMFLEGMRFGIKTNRSAGIA
jgi:hypothetical protein